MAINHMQRQNAKNPLARLQNASTAGELARPILPTVHINNNNSISYINGNLASRGRLNLFISSKLPFQLSSRRRLHSDRKKHELKLQHNLQTQRILSLTAQCSKS
jgi:hypothetical protein